MELLDLVPHFSRNVIPNASNTRVELLVGFRHLISDLAAIGITVC
jgi:hypothetical protein